MKFLKQKSKKSYFLKLLICFTFIFSIFSLVSNNIYADATIYKGEGHTIPGRYASTFSSYNKNNVSYSSHFINNTLNNANIPNTSYPKMVPENQLSNSANFGKIWWQYNNAYVYNGTTINVRFTAISWNNTSLRYNYLGARSDGSNMGGFYPRNTRVKIEFINANTGALVYTEGHFTAKDFDGATYDPDIEKMTLHNGVDLVYLGAWLTNSGQTIYNNQGIGTTNSDQEAWATLCTSGTSFEYTYTKGGYNGLSRSGTVVPIEQRYKITTKGTNASITNSITEIVKGTSRTISWSANNGYYISSIKIDGVSQSINSYRSGSYTFNNINANHTVEVVASTCFNITTEGINASISSNVYNIDPGSSRTISWTANDGYYISSVLVDNVSQSISSYRNGSYTFNNINANHTIKVVANPCYSITTSVKNGSISPNISKIDPHSNKTINFNPNAGYVLGKITVDGNNIDINKYLDKDSYSFNDITGNHTIHVEYIPAAPINVIITKEIVNENNQVLTEPELLTGYGITKEMTTSKIILTTSNKTSKNSIQMNDILNYSHIKSSNGNINLSEIITNNAFTFINMSKLSGDNSLSLNHSNGSNYYISVSGDFRTIREIKIKTVSKVKNSVMGDEDKESNLFKLK